MNWSGVSGKTKIPLIVICILFVVYFFLSADTSVAGVIYVDVDGPNDPGSGTVADPFRKIQDAINAAQNGDVVEIRPGTYTGEDNYNLDPNGKSIIIRSIGPNYAANTIIDPDGAGRGFFFHRGEDANCIIWGLTITNGYAGPAEGYNGGNVYCYESSPTIRNCTIRNGYAEGSGGGICFDYGNPTVINCTITGNVADYYGGGISCRFSSPMVTGCTIIGNTAGLEGGGIDSGGSDPNILDCVIIHNNAPLGGGINCYFPGATNVVNCTLTANSADYFGGAVHCWSGGGAIIENSILWANSAGEGTQLGLQDEGTASVAYCDVQGGQTDVYDPCEQLVWGGGNINTDPCFVIFDDSNDPNLWDFHLKSIYGRWDTNFDKTDFNKDKAVNLSDFAEFADVWLKSGNLPEDLNQDGVVDFADLCLLAEYFLTTGWVLDATTSPCIDAGDPNSDWTDEPWPNGRRINMGAYGGTNQASKNGNIADFNVDGSVNFVDFAQIANRWMVGQICIEDLTGDGVVNFADVSIFAKNWLWQK